MEKYTVTVNGTEEVWRNERGEIHRIGKPAVIGNGYHSFYFEGKRHNENGPAFVADGYIEEYWVDGKLHRIDGPAVIYHKCNIIAAYWIEGKQYTKEKFLEKTKPKPSYENSEITIGGITYILTKKPT